MKNQYFGDVNDYFKYGMLRAFGRELSIAVIWMLTPDDGSNDGGKLAYLQSAGRRPHDPELFDWLAAWRASGAHRDVRLIEHSGLLPNCRFFGEVVPDDMEARTAWFARAREFASGADLVFVDPDNGLPVKSTRPGARGWSKFVGLDEVQALYENGHSVLIYQHMSRVSRRELIRAKLRELYEKLGIEHFQTFSSFDWIGFLVTNAGHEIELDRASRQVMIQWDSGIRVANNVVIPVSATALEIVKRPARAIARQISRLTTTAGFVNRNRQEVVRDTGQAGTDHGQRIYVLRCQGCNSEYGVNGSGIFQAKCPSCAGGAPGLPYE